MTRGEARSWTPTRCEWLLALVAVACSPVSDYEQVLGEWYRSGSKDNEEAVVAALDELIATERDDQGRVVGGLRVARAYHLHRLERDGAATRDLLAEIDEFPGHREFIEALARSWGLTLGGRR